MKKGHFPASLHTLETVYIPGHTIYGLSQLNVKAIEYHFQKSNIF